VFVTRVAAAAPPRPTANGRAHPGGGGITHERLAQAGKQQGSPHALCTGCNSRARACTSPARGEAAFERLAGRAVDQRHVGEIENEHLRVLADAVERTADGGRGAEENAPLIR
jgi:hypothetical protein